MTFKGQIIAVADTSYDSKSGRKERRTLTCLDAEMPVKLKNTVDLQVTVPEFQKIQGDALMQTVNFDVSNVELFGGRIRFEAVVKGPEKATPAKV